MMKRLHHISSSERCDACASGGHKRASQSVVVLEATAADLSAIADHAVLAMARRADGTVEIVGDKGALEGLDQGARLFVDAWRERPLHKQDRPGEGLPWDADGFQPP